VSAKARAEEKKLLTLIADYNTLLSATSTHSPQELADADAIVAATRKPEEFAPVDMPFPWLDRAGREAGEHLGWLVTDFGHLELSIYCSFRSCCP
jgi:hypothetical protein